MPLRHTLCLVLLSVACSPYEDLNGFPIDREALDGPTSDAPARPDVDPAPGQDVAPAADANDETDPSPQDGAPPADDDGPSGGDGRIEGGGTPSIDDGQDVEDPPHDGEPDTPDVQDPPERPECTPIDEICDGVDNDCDGRVDDAFNFQADIRHCGGCDVVCDHPGAVPLCEQGACVVRECVRGYYDVDGDPSNGCEVERAGRTLFVDITAAQGGDGTIEAPFTQITQATAIAEEGDTIEVARGAYDGPVLIDTPFVSLRSDSFATWIDGDDDAPALQISADDVRVHRIGVNAGGGETGLQVVDQDRFVLEDVRIQNVRGEATGLLVLGGQRGQLADLTVFDVRGSDAAAHGIRIQGHEALRADGVEVYDIAGGLPFTGGITLTGCDAADLKDLDVSGVSGAALAYAISVDTSADARLTSISVTDITGRTALGVTLFESADASITDGEIADVAGRRAEALRGTRAHFAVLSGVTIANIAAVTDPGDEAAGRAYGIAIDDTADATVQRTLIHDIEAHAAWGIQAEAGTERLVVSYTTIAAVSGAADGAGFEVREAATASITRCIVATAGTRQGIRNAEGNPASSFSADTTDSFGHAQGNFVGLQQGEGNLEVDPMFADTEQADYSVTEASPVSDRGRYGVEIQLIP